MRSPHLWDQLFEGHHLHDQWPARGERSGGDHFHRARRMHGRARSIDVLLTTVTLVAAASKGDRAAAGKLVPVMVRLVPPAVEPALGDTLETMGARSPPLAV